MEAHQHAPVRNHRSIPRISLWSYHRVLRWCLFGLVGYSVGRIFTIMLAVSPPEAREPEAPQKLVTALHEHQHSNFTFEFPVCLVHVGKTAGSSISCGLGLTYANCEGMPRDALSGVHYFHMRKQTCPRSKATLLWTVRNPLTRIQSWFDFEKDRLPTRKNKHDQERLRWKRGMLFEDCYQDFVELVTDGLDPRHLIESNSMGNHTIGDNTLSIEHERPIHMTCPERAWAAILGAREFSYHEWYNYEHYWTAMQEVMDSNSKAAVLVLRTEHLSNDWSKLSKEPLFRPVNRGKSSTKNATGEKDLVDPRFATNLCRALCPEIQFYQRILERADNLETRQVEESMQAVKDYCPEYSSKTLCPGIPHFPLLKVPSREYARETKKRLFAIQE